MPRPLPALCLLIALAAPGSGLRAAPPVVSPALARVPMVQSTTPTSAVLTWRSTGPISPVVRLGPAPNTLTNAGAVTSITVRTSPDLIGPPEHPVLHSAPLNTYQYEAHLTGLFPDTAYYYGIFDGATLLTGCSPDHFLKTPPLRDTTRPLRFWVTGDTGTGSAVQVDAFQAMRQFIDLDGRPLDAFIHLGDMAYNDGLDDEFQSNFFGIYAAILRNTVTWPTMGNHEGHVSDGNTGRGPYFDAFVLPTNGEAGGVPSGTEAYYSFDLGPIHFVCLDSYDVDRSQAAAMATWLGQDLAQNNNEWLIAFWHHPPYSKGTHNSDTEDELIEMREQILPLLESHGVDLVLCGHSHVYERSMLIDRAYITPTQFATGFALDDGDGHPAGDGPYRKSAHLHPHEGTVAVVAGNGASARRFGLSTVMRVSLTEIGSVLLDLEGDTLTARMINSLGAVRDEFQVIKRGQLGPRSPLPDPWSPLGPHLFTAQRHPGQIELHCLANPAAPDAVVHYTLDGSEPTTASPVYNGPVPLTTDRVVKAFSRWRGGARSSPVAVGTVLIPPRESFRTLRLPVAAGVDDATEDQAGTVRIDEPAVGTNLASGQTWFGIRFPNIPIPRGATIYSANVQFTSSSPGLDAAPWTIYGDRSATRAAFAASPHNLSSRARTASTVSWQVPAWSRFGQRGSLHRTPELRRTIEELINEPNWSEGDAIALLFSGPGTRQAFSLESFPRLSAELAIAYDERDPLTLASDITPSVELADDGLGGREIRIDYPTLSAATALGLTYRVEGSSTLLPGSWQPLPTSVQSVLSGAPPFMILRRYRVTLPGGVQPGDTYFLRVSVTRN